MARRGDGIRSARPTRGTSLVARSWASMRRIRPNIPARRKDGYWARTSASR
jgi:hypothetical protein